MSLFGRKSPYDIDHPGLDLRSSRNADGSRRRLVPDGATTPEGKKLTLRLILNTMLAVAVYFTCVALEFIYMMYAYLALAAVLLVIYVAYNRGFALRGVTPDMLPDTLTLEQKKQRLDEAARRMKDSRWMLTVIIPFVIVFMCEALYLFVWDSYLADFFKG